MPFTLAHPAAVLPVKNKWPHLFNGTALILGSMAPDFEYFIRFKAQGTIGHSIPPPFQRYFITASIFHSSNPTILIQDFQFHLSSQNPVFHKNDDFF